MWEWQAVRASSRSAMRWRLTNTPIRLKAAMILLPPAMAAMISVGFGLWTAGGKAQAAGQTRALFEVGSAAAEATQRMQAERAAAAGVLLPESGAQPGVYEQRIGQTDQAVAEFRRHRQGLDEPPPGVAAVLARVDNDLRDLEGQRLRVRSGGQVALSAAMFGYRIAIADLIAYRQVVAQTGAGPVLADEMRAAVALSQAREAVGLQQVAVLQALSLEQLTPSLNQEIVASRGMHEQAMREFAALSRPQWRALAGRTLTGPDMLEAARMEGTVASTVLYEPVRLSGGAAQWSQVTTARADLLRTVESSVDADVQAAVDAERGRQIRSVAVQGGAVLAVLLVALLFTAQVARSLVERLRTLETSALRVASTGLPELVQRLRATTDPAQAVALAERSAAVVAVDVTGADEVGRVADAFNSVHAAAMHTAAAEARLRTQVVQMITSVARRVQVMSARVISGLDGLERDETDPDKLAQVFAVDHNATRLRRYAASLLIVAGGGPGQSQTEPVPVDQLLSGALSEVEGYQRIRFGDLVDAVVDPRAVDAVVHILAELLDNATSFSDPQEPVVVSAQWQGWDLLIRVADVGIGVKPGELERLNARLASPGMDVDVADRMGLIVVSRLAAQYAVKVQLQAGKPGGLVASVLVPAELVTRVQRVYIPRTDPALPTPLRPATAPPVLPSTGTGWGSSAGGPDAAGSGAVRTGTATDVTMELPGLGTDAAPARVSTVVMTAQDGQPVIFEQMRQASPWLWPNAPGTHASAPFDTAADAAWWAARATAQPATDGTTTTGLPRRRPGAHVIPSGPTGAAQPGRLETAAPVIDPVAVRAQVAATMRGLNAAAGRLPSPHPASTGEHA